MASIEEMIEGTQLDAELVRAADACSPERALHDATAAVQKLPDLFKGIAEAVNQYASKQKAYFGVYKDFVAVFGRELGIGVSAKLTSVKLNAAGVAEDDTEFVAALARIGGWEDQRAKLRGCIRLAEAIDKAIASRQSKIIKMNNRSTLDGSSEAEVAVCLRQVAVLERVVEALKLRKDAVSRVYCAARRDLEKFIEGCDEKIALEFVNESTGKNKEAE